MERAVLIIGIDPSFINCGIAMRWPQEDELVLASGSANAMLRRLEEEMREKKNAYTEVAAVLEMPKRDSAIYGAWEKIEPLVHAFRANRATLAQVESAVRVQLSHARDVGENTAAGSQILGWLQERAIPVLLVAPSERQKVQDRKSENIEVLRMMSRPVKMGIRQFRALHGYKGPLSQDSVDAANLIIGYNINQIYLAIRMQEQQAAASIKREELAAAIRAAGKSRRKASTKLSTPKRRNK